MKYNYDVTPINKIEVNNDNNYFIKRDDLIPFSFGGNKVRIGYEFLYDAINKGYDCILAYGSSQSNLCRIIANLCTKYNLDCYVISSHDDNEEIVETFNSILVESSVKKIYNCKKSEVASTIDNVLNELINIGKNPYYIYDKQNEKSAFNAYINAYNEIKQYEINNNLSFDYIFHASGTSMTQTGLVLGLILDKNYHTKIVGISNARNRERGKKILDDNISNYLEEHKIDVCINDINYDFIDDYILNGYGDYNDKIVETVYSMYYKNGINLDTTYTGKAFWGMMDYIEKNEIKNKNILFIHTGGTPLFFDNIKIFNKELKKEK